MVIKIYTLSEIYSGCLARKAGGGDTQRQAKSLHRVVGKTLLETQDLMNAARSQCVAQQLTAQQHYPAEAVLKRKIKG